MSIQPFIKCSDIQTSVAFYSEILDFNILRTPDSDPESIMSMYSLLERNGDCVHLSSHSGDGVFGNVIYIRVENIDEIFNQFVKNGIKIIDEGMKSSISMKPVEQTWGMKEFSVFDPDGNRITFGHEV